MAQWPSAMPSAPATPMAAALPSTSPKATADHVQTTIDPLRQDTRARDALPEGRPDLGRPDRLGPRPGEELAARGVRLASARRRLRGRARLAVGARHPRALGGAGRPARTGPSRRARLRPPTAHRDRKSAG